MADARRPRQPPRTEARHALTTAEFERWRAGLTAEQQNAIRAVIARVEKGGPTLGRPRVDGIHGTRLHKLKEARVDRGIRLLFAFDSNRNPVMLVGGDKTGKWNRWYPAKVRLAERLYLDHERSIGREAWCLSQRGAARTPPHLSR
jgi:hypothetical protein